MRVVIEVPRAAGQLRALRRLVETWATAVAAEPDGLPLVATELVSNAFDASPDDATVIVRLEREGDQLRIVVVDEGPGFTFAGAALPTADAVRGRGLALVASFVDSLTVDRVDALTVVTATRTC